jgi:hypothetical protein
MTAIVNKTIKASGGDYDSLAALASDPQDLVTADTAWEVSCDNFSDAYGAATFDLWTTSATCYLRVFANTEHGSGGIITTNAYRNMYGSVYVNRIGASGLVILEGLQLLGAQGAGASGNVGTCRLISCICRKDAISNPVIYLGGGANQTTFEIINTISVSVGSCASYPSGLFQTDGILKVYNSVFLRIGGSGAAFYSYAGSAAAFLYNCYCHGVDGGVDGTYTAIALATSDASGTIDNIPFSTDTFVDIDPATLDLHLVAASALIGAGTDLSGNPSPFDVPFDIDGDPRADPYSIGVDQYTGGTSTRRRNSLFVFGGV